MKPHIKIQCVRGGLEVLFLLTCLSSATVVVFMSFLTVG